MSAWQRSSFCEPRGCIEIRAVGGRVEIRDSSRPAEVAWCRPADLAAFVRAAKAGEYDLIAGLLGDGSSCPDYPPVPKGDGELVPVPAFGCRPCAALSR